MQLFDFQHSWPGAALYRRWATADVTKLMKMRMPGWNCEIPPTGRPEDPWYYDPSLEAVVRWGVRIAWGGKWEVGGTRAQRLHAGPCTLCPCPVPYPTTYPYRAAFSVPIPRHRAWPPSCPPAISHYTPALYSPAVLRHSHRKKFFPDYDENYQRKRSTPALDVPPLPPSKDMGETHVPAVAAVATADTGRPIHAPDDSAHHGHMHST